MKDLEVQILTPCSLSSRSEGAKLLDLLCGVYPDLAPERYGVEEPLRKVFDPSRLHEVLDRWEWDRDFLWKRKRPRVEGSVTTSWGARPRHGWISISIGPQKLDIVGLVNFLTQASVHLGADFAFIHFLTAPEYETGRASGTVGCLDPQRDRWVLSVTTHQLIKYIPELYWATLFGPPYVQVFGRDLLLSSPAAVARELDGGSIYLQLSESPFDLETDFARIDAVRQRVKEHLNHDTFFDPGAPIEHVYTVPEFHLGEAIALPSSPAISINPVTQDKITTAASIVTSKAALVEPVKHDALFTATMQGDARQAVDMVSQRYGEELDYSEQSIQTVERILASIHKKSRSVLFKRVGDYSKEAIIQISNLLGAYIGEVIRRKWGGEWSANHSMLAGLPALHVKGSELSPHAKVHKRIINGLEDDVWFYYQALKASSFNRISSESV